MTFSFDEDIEAVLVLLAMKEIRIASSQLKDWRMMVGAMQSFPCREAGGPPCQAPEAGHFADRRPMPDHIALPRVVIWIEGRVLGRSTGCGASRCGGR